MKKLSIHVIAMLFTAVIVPELFSGNQSTTLDIQATVKPWVETDILYEAEEINITRRDLIKGFMKINNGMIFTVVTNDTNGYVISVCSQEIELFTSIIVYEGKDSYELIPGGCVEIHEPYPGMKKKKKNLDYIFYFSLSAEAGEYPWPIVVKVYPI